MKNNPFTVNAYAQVKSAEFGDAPALVGSSITNPYQSDGLPGWSNGGASAYGGYGEFLDPKNMRASQTARETARALKKQEAEAAAVEAAKRPSFVDKYVDKYNDYLEREWGGTFGNPEPAGPAGIGLDSVFNPNTPQPTSAYASWEVAPREGRNALNNTRAWEAKRKAQETKRKAQEEEAKFYADIAENNRKYDARMMADEYSSNMFTDNNALRVNTSQGYDPTQQSYPEQTQQNFSGQNPFTSPDAEQAVADRAAAYERRISPEITKDLNSATAVMADAQAAVRDRENSRYTDPTGQTRSYSEYQEPDTVPEQTRTYGNYQENATPTAESDGSFVLPNGKTVYTSEGNSIQESLGYANPNKAQVRYRTDGGSVEVPAARSESTFSHLAPKAPEIPLGSTFSNLRK